jgi:hypothetical protein
MELAATDRHMGAETSTRLSDRIAKDRSVPAEAPADSDSPRHASSPKAAGEGGQPWPVTTAFELLGHSGWRSELLGTKEE